MAETIIITVHICILKYPAICVNSQCSCVNLLQIVAVYDIEDAVIPGDYEGVVTLFTKCLHNASSEWPLRIFLDAVDQLSPEDGASGMSWLPLTLPPHVKLVVSTSSEVEYRCLPVLQSLLAKQAGSMVQVQTNIACSLSFTCYTGITAIRR